MKTEKKSKEEIDVLKFAHKRLSWIDNVKRVYGWDQERAEKEWAKIFDKQS